MLRKISLKNIFKNKQSSAVKTTEEPVAPAEPPTEKGFNPYKAETKQEQDAKALASAQKEFEGHARTAKPTKTNPPEILNEDFKLDDYDIASMEANPDSIILPKPKKKPWWLVLLTDIFNGLVMACTIVLTSVALGESFIIESHPFLAFVALIPMGIAIFNIRSIFFSWIYGLCTGTFFYLFILYWIYPTVQSGTGDAFLAGSSVVALSAILALQFALFTSTAYLLKKVKWLFPLSAACAWVAWEFAHQYIAYKYMGFPWFVLGYTQFANQPLIQISSVTGAYGVSFLIAFFGFSMAYIAGKRCSFARIIYFILPVALVVLSYSYGLKTIKTYENLIQANPQKISVALMQTDTHSTLLAGYNEDVTYMLAEQVVALKGKNVNLIIWPESSYPGSFKDEAYSGFLKRVSELTGASQITGSYVEGADAKQYVAAGLFDASGLLEEYYKNKLVPFGEFLPFTSIMGPFYKAHNVATLTGDFVEGNDAGKVFNLTLKDQYDRAKTFIFGTQICFESIFPSVWRAQALSGAQFFVNISNDGWFLDTAAPYQHLRINVFRAVENRRPLLRTANTGLSAWVDSLGKIKLQTSLDKQETAVFNFYFQPRTAKTFYTLYGDIFAYLCIAFAITVLIFRLVFINTKEYD